MKLSHSQNFLTNQDLVRKLIIKSNFPKDVPILDIGVGKGIISKLLLELGYQVIGFELDPKYIETINNQFKEYSNFKLINQDFLEYNSLNFKYNIFANIPFNQTSKFIHKIFFNNKNAEISYLIMQQEAAERILGEKEGLFLALQMANFNEVKICHRFQRTDFNPAPKVNPVLLKIEKRKEPIIPTKEYNQFLDFISYIVLQQKPSILRRLEHLIKYPQFKRLCSLLEIEMGYTLYQIPKLKFFEMYKIIKEQYPLVLHNTIGYYKKYNEINYKNVKVYRTRNDIRGNYNSRSKQT